MTMSKLIGAAATVMLAAMPAMAATTNPAASLSVAKSVRANAPAAKKQNLAGGGIVIAIIAAAAVVAGIIIGADNDDSH